MKFKKIVSAVLTTAMILGSALPVSAQVRAGESEEGLLLHYDFSKTEGNQLYAPEFNDLNEFELFTGPTAGTWSASDGSARIDGGNGNKAIAKDKNFTNFVLETDITVEKQADLADKSSCQGGVVFRASNGVDGKADGYDGYYFCVDVVGQKVTLGRSSGNTWYEIASKKMTVKWGVSYHVTITAYEDHIVCYVDYNGENYAKLDVTDSMYRSGSVGMRNWLSHTSYKNMKVSEYKETEMDEKSSYTNPLLDMCADPDILYYGGTYYLYSTNAGDANDDQGIKVYTSTDLAHWTEQGWAFKKGDGFGEYNFWAPDTIERDGVFYMYYVAEEQICVATSDSPLGPFKQDVKEPMDTADASYTDNKEIDAHIFYDEASEKYYFYCVRFTDGNAIWGAELNDDMKSIKKETLTEIVKADQGWDQDIWPVNEGPFMLVKDGKYYMTYSGSHFESNQYGVGYAVSDSPLGPFAKYANNPIMQSNTLVHGAGHHCVTTSPDGKEMFMVYHCHHDLDTTEPRQLCIDRMHFTTDRDDATVLEVNGPTVTPQALPSGAVNADNFIQIENAQFEDIKEDRNTPADKLKLPEKVEIRTSKSGADAAYEASVKWDTTPYEQADGTVKEVTLNGTVVLPEGVSNLGKLPLDVKIKIQLEGEKVPAPKLPYDDVAEGEWYYDAIAYNYYAETMTGLTPTHFGPSDTLVRAQFAAVLHKMNKAVEVEYTDKFSDVTEPDWFKNAVLWAAENEIVTGYTGTDLFGPNDTVTREQMATMMYRYAKNFKKYEVSADGDYSEFPDAETIQPFAQEAMKWAVKEEIITGKTINGQLLLDPQGSANRAECATIIQRFMEKYEK